MEAEPTPEAGLPNFLIALPLKEAAFRKKELEPTFLSLGLTSEVKLKNLCELTSMNSLSTLAPGESLD